MKIYIKMEGPLHKLELFSSGNNIAEGGAFKCFPLIYMCNREGEKEEYKEYDIKWDREKAGVTETKSVI